MSDTAVSLSGVGKMYKLFGSRNDNLLDALGLARLAKHRGARYREFWALRGIDLELPRGSRIGIIGRNGAGKTTLLKLITGNLEPTLGSITVGGDVYALMDTGAGFHPEFTGYENIRAALAYQGLSKRELRDAVEDVVEFTELGEFLEQSLKTYSLGMQARLAFATATAIRPEILLIDEILGAGDAYFVSKSLERIERLTSSGAAMLIVSHSMAQISQLCETAIWLDKGRIVTTGPSLEVVRSYEAYIRELDDKRIQARNQKRRAGTPNDRLDYHEAALAVRVEVEGPEGATVELSEAVLMMDGRRGDVIEIGAPQDVDPSHGGHVVLDGSAWSAPMESGRRYTRMLSVEDGASAGGSLVFYLLRFDENVRCELELEYRRSDDATAAVTVSRGGESQALGALDGPPGEWRKARLRMQPGSRSEENATGGSELSHWPGDGSLRIQGVALTDGDGRPCAVFEPGDDLNVEITVEAAVAGSFEFLPAVVIYRLDGVNVSSQMGARTSRALEEGRRLRISVTLGNLNLGNGTFLVSPVIYKTFDANLVDAPVVYDWIDRGIEFQVVGTPPAINSVFQHPSVWAIEEN